MINLNFSDRTNIPSFHKHRNCCFLCTFTSNPGGLAAVSEAELSAPQPDGCGSACQAGQHGPSSRPGGRGPGRPAWGALGLTPHKLSEASPAYRAAPHLCCSRPGSPCPQPGLLQGLCWAGGTAPSLRAHHQRHLNPSPKLPPLPDPRQAGGADEPLS